MIVVGILATVLSFLPFIGWRLSIVAGGLGMAAAVSFLAAVMTHLYVENRSKMDGQPADEAIRQALRVWESGGQGLGDLGLGGSAAPQPVQAPPPGYGQAPGPAPGYGQAPAPPPQGYGPPPGPAPGGYAPQPGPAPGGYAPQPGQAPGYPPAGYPPAPGHPPAGYPPPDQAAGYPPAPGGPPPGTPPGWGPPRGS
jgi:hypothetical protein